jgi:hemoglobin
MSLFHRRALSALMLCLPVAALPVSAVRAAEDSPSATDAKTEEALVHKTLRDVINEGADMYNAQGRYKNMERDYAGCYHLYEGALMVARPLLGRHADLQKAIDDGMATARDTPQMEKRAFVLREVIDKIREGVGPKITAVAPPTPPKPPAEAKVPVPPPPPVKETTTGKVIHAEKGKLSVMSAEGKERTYAVPEDAKIFIDDKGGKLADVKPDSAVTVTSKGEVVVKVEAKTPALPPPPPAAKTLWDRLGGEANVAKVVDDFVNSAGKDPKVNFFRDPTKVPSKQEIADLKKGLVEFVSSATGGPLKYEGKSMKEAHKGMKPPITNEEFDAAAKDLKDALVKHVAKAEDVEAVMKVVEGTRKDIVEAKAPEDKVKPDEKKPEEKKPEEKKPEEKKPGEKGNVSGNVTFNGKPVTGGVIVLTGADGNKVRADLEADGSYKFKDLKPGEYTVAVDTEGLNDPAKPNPAYVAIPAKFRSAKTSGLTVEVKKGEQANFLNLVDPPKPLG